MCIRRARADDASSIAQLHANNWRRGYRGILRGDYLDGPLVQDRQALWQRRLSSSNLENRSAWVIEEDGELEAFVCVLLDADPDWGALIESLHVSAAWQGRGLGSRLMATAAEWVRTLRPRSGLYLWVGEENTAARRFYEHLDGKVLGRRIQSAPEGTRVSVVAYGWRELSRTCPS
jgi:GNAT superfamily N-acetyltransferase